MRTILPSRPPPLHTLTDHIIIAETLRPRGPISSLTLSGSAVYAGIMATSALMQGQVEVEVGTELLIVFSSR